MEELYLNDIDLKNIYMYYYKKGYVPIIIDKCSYLLINYFLIFFIFFLSNCIDYDGLINLNKEDSITNYIDISKIFPKNGYFVICFIILLFYTLCISINTYNQIKTTIQIKNFYKTKLNIESKELEYLNWNDIVKKITNIYKDPNLNIYTISIKILKKENIISSLYKKKLEYLPNVSKLLEWNFIYCIIDPFFNNEYKIESIIDREKLYKKIKIRCYMVLVITIISLPFTLYIIIIYLIVKNGEEFYNNPENSMIKYWNIKGYWKLRYYNELNHNYDLRNKEIKDINIEINKYHNEKNIKIKEILIRFINFVLSSVFVTLLILSILNENILTQCYIFKNKTIFWFLGILGAILAINRKLININYDINNNYKDELFLKLKKKIPIINPKYFKIKNRSKIIKIINNLYFSKLYYILMEIIYLGISPYYLYKWINHIDVYIGFILNELEEHYILGNIPSKSVFTNIHNLNKDVHSYYSFINFIKIYPEWKNNLFECNNLNNSLIDESFIWDNNELDIKDSFIHLNSLSISNT
jgi:autophagy-related protein 9